MNDILFWVTIIFMMFIWTIVAAFDNVDDFIEAVKERWGQRNR